MDTTSTAPPVLPTWLKVVYAAGQAGNILNDRLIAGWLLFFYMPPMGSGAQLLPVGLLGNLPIFGAIMILARGFDSFWDPFVANWSDRSRHPLGRRRIFMVVGCLPLALVAGGVFFPPDDAPTVANVVFLAVLSTLYFALFSVFVAPYLALLPELAPTPAASMSLSTYQAFAGLLGGAVAMVVGPTLLMPEGRTSADVQKMVIPLAVMAFVLMLLPTALIDERKLTRTGTSHSTLSLFASIKATLEERAFLPYVLGSTLFMFGFNIVSSAMPYYVTVLLGKPADFGGRIMAVALGVAAVSFPFVNWLATRFSKKRVIMAGGLSLAVVMALTPVLRDVNIAFVVFGLSGLPIAVLLSVPNAILSDICEANAQRTGQRREAMFFGTQGLFQKLNLGLSTALLAGLLEAFGNSVEQPGGVMWSGPMASVALVLSGVCFAFYPEKDVAEAQLRVVNPRA